MAGDLAPPGAAVHNGNEAGRTARHSPAHVIRGLPREDAAQHPGLSARVRGDVAVVSLRGELDIASVPALQAHLSDLRWQARECCVVDLTALTFIGCACLGVLVRHCKEIRNWGGSFALAGPQATVRRVRSVTGLLVWFEMHDTVEEAVLVAAQ